MYTFNQFNQLDKKKAGTELFKCCGSKKWVNQLLRNFPFESEELLFEKTRTIWYDTCEDVDYLEAFSHHPRIGDVKHLKRKFAGTDDWAKGEQSGVKTAGEDTIRELAHLNDKYFKKFGFIFIVCATGKSATEMLQMLRKRCAHSKTEEIGLAMGEQFKIVLIRLKKLIRLRKSFWNDVSQITTHVLDTSIGSPGRGMCISLKQPYGKSWRTIALGVTNADGRIADLLPAGRTLLPGTYQMSFDTKDYFQKQQITGFYPRVDIPFTTFDQSHYHVPLLINPFGYSTYRGS